MAIRKQHLSDVDSLTLVAILPNTFPEQINQEPILCAPWDITSLLSLSNPTMNIDANVYNETTTVSANKITIGGHGYWETQYPFWLYKYETNKIYQVMSEQDWYDYVN